MFVFFFFQAEDGIRDLVRSRGLGDVYKRQGPNHPLEQYVPWLACELSRNDTFSLVHAGQSLSRYDARVFASALGKPAASMVTTRDRLVKPRKQRALADALNAFVVEVPDDHLASWTSPDAFAKATVQLVQHVVG